METQPLEALHSGAVARIDQPFLLRTLDDVRPLVDPQRGLHLFHNGPFWVCRYTSALPTTFLSAADLELRGLIFDADTGALLSRTFHKFFNLGEREAISDLKWPGPARLEDKMDGSMIGAFVWKGDVLFHTRGGLSDHAKAARAGAAPGDVALCFEAFEAGYTPIFEHTAPFNRVVVAYREEQLTLLALRHRETGIYNDALANALAKKHSVARPALRAVALGADDLERHALDLQRLTGAEGAVAVWEDGHRVKIKALDYLRRHRILANIEKERHVYACILEDVVDDTSAALGGARGRALIAFAEEFSARVRFVAQEVEALAASCANACGRTQAKNVTNAAPAPYRPLVFSALKGDDVEKSLRGLIQRRFRGADDRDALKKDFGLPAWTVDIHSLR